MATCTGGTAACWIASQTDVLTNLSHSLGPINQLLTGGAYLIGLSFVMKALYSLKIYGEARTMMSSHTSMKEPIFFLFIGTMLLYLPSLLSSVLQTVYQDDTVLAYAPVSTGSAELDALFGSGSAVGRPLVMLIQTIGLAAFIRGWILVARASSQGQPPGGTGKGLMHVFGGVLAVNIVSTLQILNNTLYGG